MKGIYITAEKYKNKNNKKVTIQPGAKIYSQNREN